MDNRDYKKEAREKAENLAKSLTDFVNGYSNEENEEIFIQAFCKQHRTLQQSGFRLITKLIDRMSQDDYRTDGRNEHAHLTAKTMMLGYQLQLKKNLIKSDPVFWTEEKAEDQSKLCRPHFLTTV